MAPTATATKKKSASEQSAPDTRKTNPAPELNNEPEEKEEQQVLTSAAYTIMVVG